MKTLICTVGLPRSGKSTWAKEQGFPIVAPDAIRLSIHGQRFFPQGENLVWAFAWNMVRSLFHSGHDIIIFDATSLTKHRRQECIRESRYFNDELVDVKFKVFDTQIDICKDRAMKTFPDLIPVIERMHKMFEPLEDHEQRF